MTGWTPEKIEKLKTMLTAGYTLQECATEFGISREAVRRAKDRHLDLGQDDFGRGVRRTKKQEAAMQDREGRREEIRRVFNRDTYHGLTDLEKAQGRAFTYKKNNTKGKWEFTVTMSDLEWPTHCPVLGIELDWFAPRVVENSPSFDRIDPIKGYVPGNVAIISWRANRIKNDGTASEHEKIANWMKFMHAPA